MNNFARYRYTPAVNPVWFFTVEPEKEIIMILVSAKKKDAILSALYENVGLSSAGQGIAFTVPVDGVVGISAPNSEK